MNNKHNTLTCSGWGMMPSSLDALVTSSNNINSMAHRSYNALLNSLPENTHYDTAIGWSLGGQILLRLISDHKITCNTLILFATPYQYVANDNFKHATAIDDFSHFAKQLSANPQKLLHRFSMLVAKGHHNAKDIIKQLKPAHQQLYPHLEYWLKQLGCFSCDQLTSFSNENITTVHIIHGTNDIVVPFEQATSLASLFDTATIHSIESCGHAPHLVSSELTASLIL